MSMSDGSQHYDAAMLELFRKEILSAKSNLEGALAVLRNEEPALQEQLEKVWHVARELKSAALIMHFSSLVVLAEALESSSQKAIKVPSSDISGFIVFLEQSVAYLDKIVSLDNYELSNQIEIKDETLSSILKVAAGNSVKTKKDESKPLIELEAAVDPALIEIFKVELENQSGRLSNALLLLEQEGPNDETFDTMLRAIHSIKGAASIINLAKLTAFSHVFEDVLIAAKKRRIVLDEEIFNNLFGILDFFLILSKQSNATLKAWVNNKTSQIERFTESLENILSYEIKETSVSENIEKSDSSLQKQVTLPAANVLKSLSGEGAQVESAMVASERVLKVTADSLNRLMGLAGESMVESRWLQPFSESLSRIRKVFEEVAIQIDFLKNASQKGETIETINAALKQLTKKSDECQKSFKRRLSELELYINRNSSLSDRLYREVIDSRMQPFGEGVKALSRFVRDLAHQLGKKIHFEIRGKATPVDRDILLMLDAPLTHLIRNAVDHGIESPKDRLAKGKPPEGRLILEAEHRAGMLSITVSDDGRGIDPEVIRSLVISKGMVSEILAEKLTDSELVDFLFLPGFSTSSQITEISGRGIGLDAVQSMVQSVSGSINCTYVKGKGTSFNLQLPLTLSVIRALVTEISMESYAIPLNRLQRAINLEVDKIELIENRQYFHFEGKNVGLISGSQILGFEDKKTISSPLSVAIINDLSNSYGIVVDKFMGEKELVLHPIDPRLGKVQDVSSGAFMEDGSPVLILDIEDMVRTIDNILSTGNVPRVKQVEHQEPVKQPKKILVVDDSITVREVECRLLRNKGYEVDTAVNGMEGWNAMRMGSYDLVITDVDMPRMNGIELVRAIKGDSRLKSVPVMIVSYKERENDRVQGLQAGANYYLTKSGFHDETLLNAVKDLIGEP